MDAHETIENRQPLVLIADDEKEARVLLRRVLERDHFRVEEAQNGVMAIEKAQEYRPDLILIDIQMPGIDGFEAVRLLREDSRTARIPIIVVSAAAREASDVARGLGLGADDYLRKPYNIAELIARARAHIRARYLEQRLQRRTEELEALIEIGTELNQALELEQLADKLIVLMLSQIPAQSAALALRNHTGEITLTRYHGLADKADLLTAKTLPGYTLEHRDAVAVEDIRDNSPVSMIFNVGNCTSGIAAPLKHRGEVLGVLALGDEQAFSEEQFRLLRSIAEQATLAIRNAQLYTELHGYATGLESMVETRTQALKSAQAQLVRAEKLAALGTLAAGVAHEVNNPLQPLLTNLEMALEDLDAGRSVDRELLEVSENVVKRIQSIVSRLLDFARPAQAVMEPVNVDEIMREVLALAGKQLQHAHVEVEAELNSPHSVNGNADQLKQVFLNLVVNAMEAMPDGGLLTINTTEQHSHVYIAMRDTGLGIEADQLPQVFDPFFTTKADGTGLGLSVSYGIIESHGGQIEVESTPNEYTQFTVRLPLYSEEI